MYKERLSFAVQHYAMSHILLIGLFWLIRLFEFYGVAATRSMPENMLSTLSLGFVFDLWLCCVLALLVFPVYLLLYILLGPITRYFLQLVFILYVIIYLSLVSYFVTTGIPLGADFWGYSMEDIQTTVSSSAGVSLLSFVPFVIVLLMLFYAYPKVQEMMLPTRVLMLYYSVMLLSSVVYFVKAPSMSWFSSEGAYAQTVNKMGYFSDKTLTWYRESHKEEEPVDNEYPFMTDADTTDVLSPFFNPLATKPNLVFIIVEGLGGTFVGPNARYGGCTPFLDSLAQNSLYWQYTLSTTGRTFGVIPSLFGSLPYSEKGFMETAPEMPNHLTLIRLLRDQGYDTKYFYGGNATFDKQDVFLEAQGMDYVLEEGKFPSTYQKVAANSEGFTWGYSDRDLFKRSLEVLPENPAKPYLSIYLTLSTHEPFTVPDQSTYLEQVKKLSASLPADKQKVYTEFSKELSALLFMDDAIRGLMKAYQKRCDYANTIFVITGDHRMIPIPQANRIDRFHVPLIIYSPMLKKAQQFSAVNTHHDVTPTLLSFLQHQTTMVFPDKVHWLGKILDTTPTFHSMRKVALMRNKNELIDYVDGNHFLSDRILYTITPELDLEVLSNSAEQAKLEKELSMFKQQNAYVFKQNKLYKEDKSGKGLNREFVFTAHDLALLHLLGADSINAEQLYTLAQIKARENRFNETRLICKRALQLSPGYTDIRLLLGRTYLWEGDYATARKYFEDCIRRSPTSAQSRKALIENETKAGNYQKAISMAHEGYKQFADDDFIKLKKEAEEDFKKEQSTQ